MSTDQKFLTKLFDNEYENQNKKLCQQLTNYNSDNSQCSKNSDIINLTESELQESDLGEEDDK